MTEHRHRVTTSADKLRKLRNLGNVGEILLESGFEQLKPNRKEIESNRPKICVSYRIREEICCNVGAIRSKRATKCVQSIGNPHGMEPG